MMKGTGPEGEEFLVCAPVREDSAVYPGSVQAECKDCGAKVWVAPSGQKQLMESTMTVVCMKCTLLRIEKAPGTHEISVSPAAVQEVKAWQRRN